MAEINGTYKTQLHENITELQQATRRGELPREVRLVKIDALIEDYFAETGEMPDAVALERLADLCLFEDLNNPSLTKMQDEEYPIMSERQFDRRESREVKSANDMDGNAADGQKHGKPSRRERTAYENRFVDKKARIQNKERKKGYHDFTKVQPVVVRKIEK
jgi:hypothetical protein